MNSKVDWIIHFVIPDENNIPNSINAHTHGLEGHNHPELMTVLALDSEVSGAIMNNLGLRILDGERFDEEKIYTNIIQNELPVKIVKAVVSGHENCVIIFPDEDGKLPGDEGCKYPYSKQLEYLEYIKIEE